MKPRSAVLLALLSAGFAYQPNGTSASRTKNAAENAPGGRETVFDAQKLELKDWPLLTLHRFFSTRLNAEKEAREKKCPVAGDTPVEFLIATIPDPENSRYPYMFDRFVEMISRAAEDQGYTRDRYWLPWEAESAPQDTDWLKREHYQDWRSRKQEYPGIFVFRSTKAPLRVLSVLVVGENSVSGINKEQFAHALDLIGHFDSAGDQTVRILGPSFSGSATSLGLALRTTTKGKRASTYVITTGSATVPDVGDKIREAAGLDTSQVKFSSTIWNDKAAKDTFLQFLKDRGVDPTRVAILAESGTQYGGAFHSQTPSGAALQTQSDHEDDQAKKQILTAEYPMEISRLRNAYANDSELSAISGKDPSQPQQRLSIKLKALPGSADSTPAFSQTISPISQETVLLETLAMLSRRRVEYVGIVASDILDAIFLGRMVKQQCPDARLFMFDSDLIYADVAQNHTFEGMLMVTTYPLSNQPFFPADSPDPNRWKAFPNATSEGVYNACRLLMERRSRSANENDPPRLWNDQTPQLWLTVVGRDALWPLEILTGGAEANALSKRWLPRVWMLVFWLMTVVSGLFAIGILSFNYKSGERSVVGHGWVSILRAGNTATKVLLTVACGILIAAYETVALIQTSFLGEAARRSWPALLTSILISGLLLLAGVYCWRPCGRGALMACIGCACLFVATRAHLIVPPADNSSLLWMYRTIHLGSGVSPILPFLLLLSAFLWYIAVQLNRIRLNRSMPLKPPAFNTGTCLASAQKEYKGVLKSLERWPLGRWSWVAASILAFTAFLCRALTMGIRSLEPSLFGNCYLLGLFILYAMLLFGCARFLRVWCGLRVILLMLERSPLEKAFKRLGRHKELSPAAVWRWGGGTAVDITLHYAIERLRNITQQRVTRPVGEWQEFDYEQKLTDLERSAAPLISGSCSGAPVHERALERVTSMVTEISNHLLQNVLGPASSKTPPPQIGRAFVAVASAAVSPAPVVLPSKPANNEAEDFVALRFVALIRLVNLHLKNLLEFVAGALILAILSLLCYPFEPHHQIITAITICFFAMSGIFLYVFVQMNRNTIISYLNATKPGKLDSHFWHVLQFGGLPLVAVLSAQFPSIGGFLFSWVKPALENLR